jgi:hypothetical protein
VFAIVALLAVLAVAPGAALAIDRHDDHRGVVRGNVIVAPHGFAARSSVVYDPYLRRFVPFGPAVSPAFVPAPQARWVFAPPSWYLSDSGWIWLPARWVAVYPGF